MSAKTSQYSVLVRVVHTRFLFGCIDPDLWDGAHSNNRLEIAGNHSARFAPVIQPTLKTGVDALCIAALTFLRK